MKAISPINLASAASTALEHMLNLVGIDAYRLKCRADAFVALAKMGDEDIDAFVDSYSLFDGYYWSRGEEEEEEQSGGRGSKSYRRGIVDYYQVCNQLCALGNVEKMYIPPVLDLKGGVTHNQDLYELKIMEDIGITRNDGHTHVVDIGCGRGRVAIHVAKEIGAHVSGINIDPTEIDNARRYARKVGLEDQTEFLVGDENDPLPYPDNAFDGGYQIQAFTYAKDKAALLKEIFRVLKPGAKFSYLDWVLLDNYDAENPCHVDIVKRTMGVLGAMDAPRYQEIEEKVKEAGFEILISEDASINGHQAPLIRSEKRHYAWLQLFAKILPSRFPRMLRRLNDGIESFIATDELRLGTTSYHIVCQKPKRPELE